MAAGCRSVQRRIVVFASRQEIVERAEEYVNAHMGDAVSLSRLSRAVGLSERGLRNAFYSVRGMTALSFR